MHGSCYVQLIFPRCYRSKWLYLQGIDSTAADLLNTFWDFACPLHGPQHEKPLQVNEPSPCLYQFYGARQTPSRSAFPVQRPIAASAITSSSVAIVQRFLPSPLPSLRKWPDKILKTDFFAPMICIAPPSLRAEAVLVLRLVPFLLRAMFQLWFAPRFSSASRLGVIGIRTLEPRWRGHSLGQSSRARRGDLGAFSSRLCSLGLPGQR